VRRALAQPVQALPAQEAGQQAQRRGGRAGLGQPGLEGLGRVQRQPGVQPTAEDALLVPALQRQQRAAAGHQPAGVGRGHHAAGQHVGRVRPLPAEVRHDLQHLAGLGQGLAVDVALEGLEGGHQRRMQRIGRIARVAQVRREEEKGLAQVVLQALGDQAEVADAGGVGRHRRGPDLLQRQHAGIEVGGAADAADPRRDDHRVARGAAEQDLLEAAVHGALGARGHHHAVLQRDLHAEVAFDAVEIEVQFDAGHGGC
jgi:hypothetical protein